MCAGGSADYEKVGVLKMLVRYVIAFCFITGWGCAAAQKTELFYDYNWKSSTPENAKFYSTVEKTDSGWFRNDYYISTYKLQMKALYEDADCKIINGYCTWFHANGIPSTVGRMIHNKREGVCVQYHPNGMIADSATYHNGIPVGARFMWHRNGFLADSISHINDSMDVQVSWFDDGALKAAGYLLKDKPVGKWKYYHRNSEVAGIVIYENGKSVSKEYFNEDGSPQADTAVANSESVFKNGGINGWRKYLEKTALWPHGLQLVNTNAVTVGVEFTINEEGKPEDVGIYIPFHDAFDKIAIEIIRKSPVWKPAMQHNRKVKQRYRQPVTFQQTE